MSLEHQRILLCGVNWLGDSIMSMPAIQVFRQRHPRAFLALLVKPKLAPLWKMHSAMDEIMTMDEGVGGTWEIAGAIRRKKFDCAYVLPNSFRSALIPFWAGVPARIGASGHFRRVMLTTVVETRTTLHQAFEYMNLLNPDERGVPPAPLLVLSEQSMEEARKKTQALVRPLVGFIPGAARGPSKRWPAAHFVELGQMLNKKKCGIVLFGSAQEKELCDSIAKSVGGRVLNLAGETGLVDWAALLCRCDVVVCNDSGGMHLASAVGVPVVALYGMTDPAKTGPLGTKAKVLQDSSVCARDIGRSSEEAEKCLAALRPEKVYEAVQEFL